MAAGVVLVRGGGEPARGRDLGLALLTAAFIAAYTVVDKEGLEHADALPYLEAVLAPTAVIYVAATAAIRGTEAVKAEANRSTLLAGLGMFAAYGLVLAALERGPAAGVAAVRECSVVIAAGLAAAFLNEPLGGGRLAGAVLVTTGVAAIAAA